MQKHAAKLASVGCLAFGPNDGTATFGSQFATTGLPVVERTRWLVSVY
ncbi:MAG TPA: hypothetical protein VI386_01370 [Candidatus Sulfotelmatobacter sp.]